MTARSSSTPQVSVALVPYDPTRAHISLKEQLELVSDRVARESMAIAKYEATQFPQIASNFTGRNFVCLTDISVTPSKSFKTDSCIPIEIFSASPGDHKAPILIFSHGYTTLPAKYRTLLGELASHGYTVLSLTHPSSIEEQQGLKLGEESTYTEHLAAIMANNIQYVLDQVCGGALKDLGDPNRIVLAGHSIGGAASIMVARTNPTVAGCINLDGFLKGTNRTDGLAQPLFMITGDTDNYKRSFEEGLQHPEKEIRDYSETAMRSLEEYEILNSNSAHSEKLPIQGAGHMDFTDQPFRDYLAGNKPLSVAMRVHTFASQEMLKFMNSVCRAQ